MDRLSRARRGWLMSRVGSRDTLPELRVRRAVFGMGYRYRLNDPRYPGKPDLVFPRHRKIVFVHGCFWHGHEACRYARLPKTRVRFWTAKIERNRERDREVEEKLRFMGWRILTVWQCDTKDAEKM